jgi:glycosyltransferase involved in cell wall biosynthesis
MISVLLATYNGEKYIRSSIDSVLNQDYPCFELLIGFNGTREATKNIVSEYNDPRIRVFDFGVDRGKGKTLNKLLKESSYDYICIQDDDDLWMSTKLSKQLVYIDEFDVIGSRIQYIDSNNNFEGIPRLFISNHEIVRLSMSGNNQIANTSAMFRKSKALEIGGWREDIDGIEDYDLWLRMMRNGCTFFNHPEVLVSHRIHPHSNFNTKHFDLSMIL